MGGPEDGAVRIEVVVGGCGRGQAQLAATGDHRAFGDGLRLPILGLLGGLRLSGLRAGLLSGLLRLLLGSPLLHSLPRPAWRRLLGLLLRLRLRHGHGRLVIVIVAATDQRQAGRTDPGAPRRAEQRAPTQRRRSHALPVALLGHLRAPLLDSIRCAQG